LRGQPLSFRGFSDDMIDIADTASGKTHRDENFPVASFLLAKRHHAPIMAFYDFVRAADDISDHPTLTGTEKIALLDRLDAALAGAGPDEIVAARLRTLCKERRLNIQHAHDLLVAFRRDITKLRYNNWQELMDYCRYSAMPVGRFVLDVHGEKEEKTWPANDALCAALQIINHLQDCGKDYRSLNRIYLTRDLMHKYCATDEMLGHQSASPAMCAVIKDLVEQTATLLDQSRDFAESIQDTRLAMEVGAIQALAEKLTSRLRNSDPLSQNVHANKLSFALTGAYGALNALVRRPLRAWRLAMDPAQ